MDKSRSALIVANDEYSDPKLRQLRGPSRDADALSRVLADESIGDFNVEVSRNEPSSKLRRRLAEFFADRAPDDLLLLHFSCHGIKDDDGVLYFATPDTEMKYLDASAIPSDFVNHAMATSRSRRIALFLDCCYSGAFSRGARTRASEGMDIAERFNGRGQVVITASSSMEYSFEGDELLGEGRPSVFTSALVEGLENGAADRNGDGYVSVDELYDYIYGRVREATPNQAPRIWISDLEGELFIARNPRPDAVLPSDLPRELEQALENPFAAVREGAARELGGLLKGRDRPLAIAAERALTLLAGDDSRRVSEAAVAELAALGSSGSPSSTNEASQKLAPHRAVADARMRGPENETHRGDVSRGKSAEPPTDRDAVATRFAEEPDRVDRAPREKQVRGLAPAPPATKADSGSSDLGGVLTDDPEKRIRRRRLWSLIADLGFGPRRGQRTWYHPTMDNVRFVDKKNNVNFERYLADGRWHVWENFPLFSDDEQEGNLSAISYLVQHVDGHSPAWEASVNRLPPADRRAWMEAYKAGKANPW